MNHSPVFKPVLLGAALIGLNLVSTAGPLTIQISVPASAESGYFKMGTPQRPDGRELTLNSRSLLLDGKPWLPVMGEFHYSRYPDSEWRDELLKMKAGGVDIVSTYVFWIHHEEVEGQFDWSGQRSLRKFVGLCAEMNLPVIVRCGPWCHGEVRNGGLPDWVVKQKDYKPRTEDASFLEKVRALYGEIEKQLHGLLWKDGGSVIGIQLDNEFGGPASYLLALKKIAREAGLDVPLYTRTGWPNLRTPMPLGEMAPLFGSYADGFWERQITPMPGDNWSKFLFSSMRIDTDIGADQLGKRKAQDDSDAMKYPYLACEIGGGMMNAYHRRVKIYPNDPLALALIHLGSGNNLPGYYMYHGGCNPDGKLSTLNESQATGYPNDLPVKNYDFQAPLGEFGELNPPYHSLRRVHLFLRDFGPALANMPPSLPEVRPTKREQTGMLRWAVRSDGRSGFVFVNNYQRLQPMTAKTNVQFALQLPAGKFIIPEKPVTVPADNCFFWPFNFDLGGVNLIYATAQPICRVDDGSTRTVFFAQTPGVSAEFVFDDSSKVVAPGGKLDKQNGRISVLKVNPGTSAVIRVETKDGGKIQIVLLDDNSSLALWKGSWAGSERAFLSRDALLFDGDALRVVANKPDYLNVEIFPAPAAVLLNSNKLASVRDGVFTRFNLPVLRLKTFKAEVEEIKPAGPLRKIPLSKGKNPVALAPEDADFSEAAVWQIRLPENPDFTHDPMLRFRYVGDVARVTLNGRLIQDDFYNGNYFDLGLHRFAGELGGAELRIAILPLRKGAPIYLAKEAWPSFGNAESKVELKQVEVINRCEARLTAVQ